MEDFKGEIEHLWAIGLQKKVFKSCEVLLRHVWKAEGA